MANTRDFRNKDTIFTGTDGITLPKGTTGERSGTDVGKLRYNTELGFLEQYNASGWAGIDAPPTVSSISGIINEDTDSTITISGSNFKSGSTVSITGAGVSGAERSLSTVFVSSSELQALTNAGSVSFVGGASFNVKVTNPSGLAAVLEPAGTVDRDPTWSTSAGTIATVSDSYTLSGWQASRYTDGGTTYQVIKRTQTGTTSWTCPTGVTSVDILVVGGGGGGGGRAGAGGGAGGLVNVNGVSVTAGQSYTVTVGSGGSGGPSDSYGGDGGNSVFGSYTALGGGGAPGGNCNENGRTGGNGAGGTYGGVGGGSTQNSTYGYGVGNQGGHSGNNGCSNGSYPYKNGGGGGAGGAGGNGDTISTGVCGNGGPGLAVDITGQDIYYAGGGGGGGHVPNSGSTANNYGQGDGGIGGGGSGGHPTIFANGYPGANGFGGGGGGAYSQGGGSNSGGSGGSGVVIIRYALPSSTVATVSATDPDGGSITYSLDSGSVPGLSFNTSTGAFTGVPEHPASGTSYALNIGATSNGQTESRTFNIVLNKKSLYGRSPDRAAQSPDDILADDPNATTGPYWLDPTGDGTYKKQYWCLMNPGGASTGGWALVMYLMKVTDNTFPMNVTGAYGTIPHYWPYRVTTGQAKEHNDCISALGPVDGGQYHIMWEQFNWGAGNPPGYSITSHQWPVADSNLAYLNDGNALVTPHSDYSARTSIFKLDSTVPLRGNSTKITGSVCSNIQYYRSPSSSAYSITGINNAPGEHQYDSTTRIYDLNIHTGGGATQGSSTHAYATTCSDGCSGPYTHHQGYNCYHGLQLIYVR